MTEGYFETLAPALREAVWALDRDLRVGDVTTLKRLLSQGFAAWLALPAEEDPKAESRASSLSASGLAVWQRGGDGSCDPSSEMRFATGKPWQISRAQAEILSLCALAEEPGTRYLVARIEPVAGAAPGELLVSEAIELPAEPGAALAQWLVHGLPEAQAAGEAAFLTQ